MSEQEQIKVLAQEQAERVVQRLMRRYSTDTQRPIPPSAQDGAFRDWLGLASGMPPAELSRASVEQADIRLIPPDIGRQRLCVALRTADGAVALVLADPFDRDHRLWLEARLRDAGHPRTRWYVTPVQALLGFIDRIEQTRLADEARHTGVYQPARGLAAESQALHHINDVLRQALGARATHVHWLQGVPDGAGRPIPGEWRMRIEGVLRPAPMQPPRSPSFDAVFEALQAAATRDGHLPVVHAGRQLTVQITVLAQGRHERAAVLRLPDAVGPDHPRDLADLGHEAPTLEHLRQALQLAHGLCLVVAPPGAGQSTTLQALAREVAASGQRVLLLAQPTAGELADACAQDLDRLLIDGLTDPGAAARLADELLQGRPVVLGMAAPDPGSALLRLERLGLSAAVLATVLKGGLVQTLLRLNCPSCSRPLAPAPQGQPPSVRGLGCTSCGHTGHVGRQVISRWWSVPSPMPQDHRAGLEAASPDWVCAGLVSREEARRVGALAV
jgi:general secretion pathway protein E